MNGQVCLLEKTLKRLGFVLTHDGQRNPGQFKLPPEEVRCFTRKYRLKLDGEFVNTWAVFKYDERSEFADFEIMSRAPNNWGKQKVILATEGERDDEDGDRVPAMQEDTQELAKLR